MTRILSSKVVAVGNCLVGIHLVVGILIAVGDSLVVSIRLVVSYYN